MHEKLVRMSGHTRGQMREQELVPSLERGETESRGEIDARFPLHRVHARSCRAQRGCFGGQGVSPPERTPFSARQFRKLCPQLPLLSIGGQ
jgi:hypothetical protein